MKTPSNPTISIKYVAERDLDLFTNQVSHAQISSTLEEILRDLSTTGRALNPYNVSILAECRYGSAFAGIIINHIRETRA